MRSRSRSGPVDAAEVGRTRRAGQWSSDMPPRTSRSEESSSDGGWSQMSTRPGSDTCSTDGAVGSPTHRLSYARIADTCTHPATDKLPDIAGRLPPWQSRTETGGAFWGMTVGARLHTTYWGLLKQPDNQNTTSLGYRNNLEKHAIPKWGSVRLPDMKAIDLDRWFHILPLAAKTKAHIRSVMRQVFEYAMLCELYDAQRNPMDLIRLTRARPNAVESLSFSPPTIFTACCATSQPSPTKRW